MFKENNIIKKTLDNISNYEKENIKAITLHCYGSWFDNKAQYGGFEKVKELNDNTIDYGFNYLLDQYDILEIIKPNLKANPFSGENFTYIATSLFQNKISDNSISICIFISKEHDYEETEKSLIIFLSYLLKKYKLKAKDIWRGFDLSKEDKAPLHYLNNEIFKKLVKQVEDYQKFIELNKEKEFDFTSSFDEIKKEESVNEYVFNLYEKYKDNANKYSEQFEPWDKNIEEIKEFKNDPTVGDLKSKEYPTKNTLQYKITNNPPGEGEHCMKSYDKLDGIETQENTMVEPIYPDLITPPGGEINIADGFSESAIQSNSNTPLTVEDFEKRQKTFNINDFEKIKKSTVGRPINTDDPFPVDEQIKKLEEHFPKVKIDKTIFDFSEDNHPQSALGKAMAKNYAMTYDMINELSKRTEKRLVKIENNLATVMRNLFRISSRININCVYYGGQSVYGKYKCIRCLHDNRLDDGAIVSLDQCLCCTRYEPILGQVYAILNESGTNVAQVIDDLQMSYNELYDYNVFNNVNEFHTSPEAANLTKDSNEIPMPFRENKWADTEDEKKEKEKLKTNNTENEKKEDNNNILIKYNDIKEYLDIRFEDAIILDKNNIELSKDEYIILNKNKYLKLIIEAIEDSSNDNFKNDNGEKINKDEYIDIVSKKINESYVKDNYYNGFKMDWTPTLLETHKANINEYDVEKLENGKTVNSSDLHQGLLSRDVFIDSREKAVEYEKLEFNTKDYEIDNFSSGNSISSSSGIFGGMGASAVRNKIVEYAKKAVELCAADKAFYDQGKRDQHDDKAVNGISYWDCSSLVESAYKYAGITGIAGNTASEYPACLDSNGGILIPIAEQEKALPGDIVWVYKGNKPTTQEELQKINYQNTSALHHVAIYIGDGKIAHASGKSSTPNIKISSLYGECIAFGRPKDLIELDKQSSIGACGVEVWDRNKQGISDELWNASNVADSNTQGMIEHMTKYGYKDILKQVATEKGLDPYFIASIIAIETSGDPTCGGNYPGIMQSSSGFVTSSLDGIEKNIKNGCDDINQKASWLKSKGWTEQNMPLLATAHNCGPYGTTDALGHSHETKPSAPIPMMGKVYDLTSITISEAAEVIYNYTKQYQRSWNAEEKRTYATKILRAYNLLYSQNILA